MTVFWSRAHRQRHVTICLIKFAVGERNVAIVHFCVWLCNMNIVIVICEPYHYFVHNLQLFSWNVCYIFFCTETGLLHFELELTDVVTTSLISEIFVTHRKGHQLPIIVGGYWGRVPPCPPKFTPMKKICQITIPPVANWSLMKITLLIPSNLLLCTSTFTAWFVNNKHRHFIQRGLLAKTVTYPSHAEA